ncbi:hypothetical protein LIER_00326 [Lithospermum erythrorhizon]|uniref:Sieve element occlusion n=1 Tax=Lithospermum erythrorhizon TaxID=34254 RepID=A0AAV3NH09_LITER
MASAMHGTHAAAAAAAARSQQIVRRERGMFSASEDSAMIKQISSTHTPDGRQVDVIPLIQVIEELLHQISPSINDHHHGAHGAVDSLEEKVAMVAYDGILEGLSNICHKISCELACKCTGGGDAHTSTMAILGMLSTYQWDAKLVLTLGAFAVNFGEFWLTANLVVSNPIAKSLAVLKQMPDFVEHSQGLKPRFDAINDLVKVVLEVTKCVIDFNDLPSKYISDDAPSLAAAKVHIPAAVYWTIRSMVVCASQIARLPGMSYELMTSTTDIWEPQSLAHKLRSILEELRNHLRSCHHHIDEKKHAEYFAMLIHLFESTHMDNMRVLKALFYLRNDLPSLVVGTTQTTVNIEALRRRTTLLLISDLDISHDELTILINIYQQGQELPYDIVWIPMVESSSTPSAPSMQWSDEHENKFRMLQKEMPWYTISNPALMEPAVIRYIKEIWRFTRRTMLVVLDPQGKIASPNAIHMFWIWGNLAFPFTHNHEKLLWEKEAWKLELVVDGIDNYLLDWMAKDRHICLYGGEDLEWIRKFTTLVKQIAARLGIEIDMMYVGKKGSKERVRKMNEVIVREGVSNCFENLTMVWFFWTRLESMLHSKMQHGNTVENDQILQGVITILSYDGSEQGWALFSKGSSTPAGGKSDVLDQALGPDFHNWESQAMADWENGLRDELQNIQPPHHCNRLIFPGIDGDIPATLACAECGRSMEKFLMYRCCIE